MMKSSKFIWGIALVAVAVLLLLNAFGITLGLPESIPLWRILLGALCAVWTISELIKLNIPGIFFPLTFIVMLFERELAVALGIHTETGDIASTWLFLLIALLLTVGTSLILPRALRGHGFIKIGDTVKHKFGKHVGHVDRIGGRSVRYIDCSNGISEDIENELSACEIYFINTAAYDGNGTLTLNNDLGSIILHVPADWIVTTSIENSLGSIKIPHQAAEGGKILHLKGDNSLGSIVVLFYTDSEEN
jgi:hypothetical protein